MKICWDNLEDLRYNKKTGKWYKGKSTYIYKETCKNCREPFLSYRNKEIYCCTECVYNRGFTHSIETKKRISESHKGKTHSKEHNKNVSISLKGKYTGEKSSFYGKHHTEESKKKISESHKGKKIKTITKEKLRDINLGKKLSVETKLKISKANSGRKSYNKKSYYSRNNIPYYDTYAPQLEWCEEVRRSPRDRNILEVKCVYCGRWYIPKLWSVKSRRDSINKESVKGELRFYCSNSCKNSCPLYGKTPEQLMKEDAIRVGRLSWLDLGREVQAELRQLVLERDRHKCTKCGSLENLHCHHILPVTEEPLLSADIDNCITLCEDCHKEAHKNDGCRYGQLRMEEC